MSKQERGPFNPKDISGAPPTKTIFDAPVPRINGDNNLLAQQGVSNPDAELVSIDATKKGLAEKTSSPNPDAVVVFLHERKPIYQMAGGAGDETDEVTVATREELHQAAKPLRPRDYRQNDKKQPNNPTRDEMLELLQKSHPGMGVNLAALGKQIGIGRERARQLYDELSQEHDLPPVAARLKRLQFSPEETALLDMEIRLLERRGLDTQQIADKIGISIKTARQSMRRSAEEKKRAAQRQTPASSHDAEIIDLRERGLADQQMAEQLNISLSKLRSRIHKLLKEGVIKKKSVRVRGPNAKTKALIPLVEPLMTQGLSYNEVAQRLNIDRWQVARAASYIPHADREHRQLSQKPVKKADKTRREHDLPPVAARLKRLQFSPEETALLDMEIRLLERRGLDAQQIAATIGISTKIAGQFVRQHTKEKRRVFVDQVKTLRLQGLSEPKIKEALGKTGSRVANALTQLKKSGAVPRLRNVRRTPEEIAAFKAQVKQLREERETARKRTGKTEPKRAAQRPPRTPSVDVFLRTPPGSARVRGPNAKTKALIPLVEPLMAHGLRYVDIARQLNIKYSQVVRAASYIPHDKDREYRTSGYKPVQQAEQLQEAANPAIQAPPTPEQPGEIERFGDEERRALLKDGARIYVLEETTIAAQIETQKRKRMPSIAGGVWGVYGEEELPAAPSRRYEVAIYPEPTKFFVEGTAGRDLDEQERLVQADAQSLRERLGVECIDEIIPDEASTLTELTFKHYDRTGEWLFGPKYGQSYQTREDILRGTYHSGLTPPDAISGTGWGIFYGRTKEPCFDGVFCVGAASPYAGYRDRNDLSKMRLNGVKINGIKGRHRNVLAVRLVVPRPKAQQQTPQEIAA